MPDVTLTPVAGDPWNGGAQDLHPSVAPPLTVSLAPQQVQQNAASGDAFTYGDQGVQPEATATAAQLGAVGTSAVSGHAGDDLVGWLGANLPQTSSKPLAYGMAAASMPAVMGARALDAYTDAARWAQDVQAGRYGTDVTDPASQAAIMPGAVQTAMAMGAPGMAMAEEGALGAAGGRGFVSLGTGERMHVNAAEARDWASRFDSQAARRQAMGFDPASVAEAQGAAQAMRDALPHLDSLAPDPGTGKFTPAKIAPAGDRAISVATDPRHAPYDDVRTYRVYPQPDGGLDGVTRARDLGKPLGYAEMKQREDGRWEVGMVNVNPSARGQGVARDLYSGIEADLGQKMQPSGILLPDGHAMWQRRDPTAVQWHQQVQDGQGASYHVSPRWLQENAGAWAQSDPTFDASMRAALDRVPPEGRTPEAINAMFSGGGLPIFAQGQQPPQQPASTQAQALARALMGAQTR